MAQAVVPRSVVLNLVRVAPSRSASIKLLLRACALFGLQENAVRVAVTRCVALGLLDSDERGSYRLGSAAQAVSEHIEQWHRGEARLRPWSGHWLAVALPPKPERSARRASLQALARVGLREGLPNLWLRPDNLRATLADTTQRLRGLGLEDGATLFRASDFDDALVQRVMRELWPLHALTRSYEHTCKSLERSLAQLERMPRETALVQSFVLGGEAIRVLATDPLLPEEILASEPRARLTETMLRYDQLGRSLWRRFATEPELAPVKARARAG